MSSGKGGSEAGQYLSAVEDGEDGEDGEEGWDGGEELSLVIVVFFLSLLSLYILIRFELRDTSQRERHVSAERRTRGFFFGLIHDDECTQDRLLRFRRPLFFEGSTRCKLGSIDERQVIEYGGERKRNGTPSRTSRYENKRTTVVVTADDPPHNCRHVVVLYIYFRLSGKRATVMSNESHPLNERSFEVVFAEWYGTENVGIAFERGKNESDLEVYVF